MKNKYIYPITAAFFVIIAGITAWMTLGQDDIEETQEKIKPIRIAVTPTNDCLPLIIAIEQGITDSIGIPMSYVMYSAHNDCDTAIINGSVSAGFSDNVRAVNMQSEGSGVIVMHHDNLNWTLVSGAKLRINKASQLKDKMIAMSRKSATEILSERLMQSTKLTAQQTFLIPVNSVLVRYSMIIGGQMDAAWLPEPQAQLAIKNGAKVLASSAEINDVYGVLVIREDKAKGKNAAEALSVGQRDKLKTVYNMMCDSLNKNGIQKYADTIKKSLKLSDKEISQLSKTTFRHL